MRSLHTFISATVSLLLMTAVSAASASAIDVQFSAGSGHAQTGAAVVGQAGDVWNDFTTGTMQSTQALVDTAGALSGVGVTFSSAQSYESDTSYTQFTGTPYANLMQGYLVDRGPTGIDVTFSGLVAGHEYGMFVYTQGDDNSTGRSIGLIANGGATLFTNQTNASTFTEGDNYLYLVTTANANGVIDLKGDVRYGEGNINGIQLLAVPEPSSLVLMMAGFLMLAGLALRHSRAR
jgi:hypothetical protein